MSSKLLVAKYGRASDLDEHHDSVNSEKKQPNLRAGYKGVVLSPPLPESWSGDVDEWGWWRQAPPVPIQQAPTEWCIDGIATTKCK